MIVKSILGEKKEFASKEDVIAYVKNNLVQILDFKKSVEQKSVDKGSAISCKVLNNLRLEVAEKAITTDKDYYYIAVNTTRILDTHDDFHDNGIWNKTVSDQQGRNYLVDSHELTLKDTIVRKEHIEMFVAKTTFASLGMPYEGATQVLVYKFRKDKVVNDAARKWLESGDAIQASVRMQYISIEFALDSNHPDDAKAKQNYDNYIDKIANKNDFEYIPYFFIIKEAKNTKESSLVPFGSNPITGNIIKNTEPLNEHSKRQEPHSSTLKQKQLNNLLEKLKQVKC